MAEVITHIDMIDVGVTLHQRKILTVDTLTLPAGKVIAVLGRNGAGKTTFLKCLVGLHTHCTGNILLNGKTNIDTLSTRERARLLTWIPETPPLPFPFSVQEVVLMGRYPHHQGFPRVQDHDTTHTTLNLLDLEKLRSRNVNSLSRGERQLVFLARGINNHSPIIVVDEPASNLDLHHELQALTLLRSLTEQGKTVIISLHNPEHARRFSDTVIIITSGRIKFFPQANKAFTKEIIDATFGVRAGLARDESGGEHLHFSLP